MKKAIILFSGGLDSTTLLYYAKDKGFQLHCLIFDYGQRHRKEIQQAKLLAEKVKAEYKVVKIALPWQGSSLLDKKQHLPKRGEVDSEDIPSTYVPARNIIFVSFAASYAEVVGAKVIFIGANAIDYSGYPDCRPVFFEAYQKVLHTGLKTGTNGRTIKIHTPLIHKTKAQIICLGKKLKVPYELTWSCYAGTRKPCGECDSCLLRQRGFETLKMSDPAI